MAKIMKVSGKIVALYVFGRTLWLALGTVANKAYTKGVDLSDAKACVELGLNLACEAIDEAEQGWSYLLGRI